MNQKLTRWMAVAALAIAGTYPFVARSVKAVGPVNEEVAQVESLKTQAFEALRAGNFNEGNDLLSKAAKLSPDPALMRMHDWTNQFEDQIKLFDGERRTAYDKAVENVHKVLDKGHPDAALDFANRAQLLSDDKKGFSQLPWVRSLIDEGIKRAAQYETSNEWYRAMLVYSDLAAVEPASRDWKEKLKFVTNRVRLLAIYAPEDLRKIQDTVSTERDAVEAIVNPTTQPATKPAEMVRNENFKSDWQDVVKGAQMSMLISAMHQAYTDYYRDVTYKGLMLGGLAGVDAVVNTGGMEKTFPSLADAAKHSEFQKYVDNWKKLAATSTPDTEEDLMNQLLTDDKDGLLAVNARTLKLPDEVLITEFTDGALATLDPFTSMIWPTDVAEFTTATQGEFSGIGVQIMAEDNGDLRVVRPLPDGPAIRMGVRAGDIIARINGKSAKNITSDEAVRTITGPSGTTVNLTIRTPDGTMRNITVKRAKIKVESVEGYDRVKAGEGPNGATDKWNYFIDPENQIAYLRITSFSGFTVKELHAAIDSMGPNVNGLIIDLRGNPGGLLQAAIGVCDEFLKEGVIVSTHPDRETRNPPTSASARDTGDEFTKPLVVLVNQYSASASEIVSGALKDDHRAILVGQRTFGKGSVQQIFPLDGEAILKLTTAHYYLPSGRCIHREENSTTWGVDPDLVVDMTPEQMRTAQEAKMEMETGEAAHDPLPLNPNTGNKTAITPQLSPETKIPATQPTTQAAAVASTAAPTTQPVRKTLLEADPQLSAALLVLRLELTGAHF
jgi:carboxyl-terminal processing protease